MTVEATGIWMICGKADNNATTKNGQATGSKTASSPLPNRRCCSQSMPYHMMQRMTKFCMMAFSG